MILVLCSAVGSDPRRLARDVPAGVAASAVRSRRLKVRDGRMRRWRERKVGQLGLVLYKVELQDRFGNGALLLGRYVFMPGAQVAEDFLRNAGKPADRASDQPELVQLRERVDVHSAELVEAGEDETAVVLRVISLKR